ncbi:hypothetical protein R1sor_010055 [Riccia sorocarpa]|uniref:Uncharacterized protein n=1 Tax=Riccia sorocarpa TaxID=122646 RepID=A0ABD3HYV8_9MARC
MDVPREWRVRLRNVPLDLDVIVIVAKDREGVMVEFDQRWNSQESSETISVGEVLALLSSVVERLSNEGTKTENIDNESNRSFVNQ